MIAHIPKIPPRLSFHCLLVMILFTGCTKLRKDWILEGYEGKRHNTVAVLGISKTSEERAGYEKDVYERLERAGIRAVQGLEILPEALDLSDADTVSHILRARDIGAILTISWVTVEDVEFDGTSYIVPDNYNRFSKFYSRRFRRTHTPSYNSPSEKYVMEALLYDLTLDPTNGGVLVWRGEMAILDPRENQPAKDRFVRRTINHLISEGILTADQEGD